MGKWLDENYDKIFRKYTKKELINEVIAFSNGGKSLGKISEHFFNEVLYKTKTYRYKLSPMEYLSDDKNIEELIEYMKTKPKFYLEENGIINNVKMSLHNRGVHTWRVANFKPEEARKIYNMLPIGSTIYDYSCGWGSRMLAAMLSGYNYLGTDPNTELHKQLIDCSNFIKENCMIATGVDIRCTGSEIFHEDWVNKVDMCFSSPPYFNLEVYTDEETQSYNKYKDYSSWIKNYMIKTILNCDKYLKHNGLFIMNIKDTIGINMYTDISNIIKALIAKGILNWKEEKPINISIGSVRNYAVNDEKIDTGSEKELAMCFRKL